MFLFVPLGRQECYEDGQWREIEERVKLSKVEGQVWLALHRLLLDNDCQQKYQFTNFSKNTILQVCYSEISDSDTVNPLPYFHIWIYAKGCLSRSQE